MQPRIFFITGTDTSLGETVLTGLLLSHLRQTRRPAFALKPFCSGGRADAELFHALQDGELSLDEINPFHFKEPVAPLVAARLHRRKIPLSCVLNHIRDVLLVLKHHPKSINPSIHQSTNPILLVEGAGGLHSPLGESRSSSRFTFHVSPRKGSRSKIQSHIYSSLALIKALNCEVLLVTANRLGTINHTLLALDKLRQAGAHPVLVLNHLQPAENAALDTRFNGALISQIAKPLEIVPLPFLGKCSSAREIRGRARKMQTVLRKILGPSSLSK